MDKNKSVSNCQHSPPLCIRPFNTVGSDGVLHVFGFLKKVVRKTSVVGDHETSRIGEAQVWKYSSRFSNQLVHLLVSVMVQLAAVFEILFLFHRLGII